MGKSPIQSRVLLRRLKTVGFRTFTLDLRPYTQAHID
mgnify:CR=1 FL=1